MSKFFNFNLIISKINMIDMEQLYIKKKVKISYLMGLN